MRQSYLKNAALLTGADIVLRLAGMGLRIWLANALGGEGMGLYQLVLAVYSLFVTLATSGVSVAATRLMAEELSRSRAEARGMLVRLLGAALLLGSAALAAQFGLAGLAAKWWLGDVRATGALRVSAFGMPWMAVSAVLRGFFIARRQVGPNVVSQLVEQTVRISAFWFNRFKDLMPNHMISCDVADLPEEFQQYSDYLAGRSMLVKKAQTVPIECIVRGYLTGSGKKTYDQDGTVCGIKLPAGLTEASKLPEPIFTPSTKAELGDHDENISFERCCEIVGTDVATQLRDASLAIYKAAAEYAATRGIIIADTKFEFGFIDGQLTLIDECLTPDSSRFWPAEGYQEGSVQPSYDKQYVRDWLRANWDMQGDAPHLPADVLE